MAKSLSNLPALSKSEWLVMARLWAKFTLTAAKLAETELDGKRLPETTVRTLLRRLVAKKAVGYSVDEQNASLYHYFPLICEQDCMQAENNNFLEQYYQNNKSKFFMTFMDSADLTNEEIENFKKILNAKKREN
jgi:BlaI family penicillinase repressor